MHATLASIALCLLSGCYLSHERDPARAAPDGGPADRATSDCPSALAVTPSPVVGYCPTRANRSEREAPTSAPELAWELELPDEVDRFESLVVGDGGRIYLPAASQLIAVDDRGGRGRIAWTARFEGRPSSPVLLPGGAIFVVVRVGLDRSDGVWLDDEGREIRRAALPAGIAAAPVVGERGTFFFSMTNVEDYTSRLVGWDPAEGRELWRSRIIARSSSAIALAPGDRLVVVDPLVGDDGYTPRLTAFDGASGEVRWSTTMGRAEEPLVRGPAVGPDGRIHAVLWTDERSVPRLASLDLDGVERLRVALPVDTWGGGVGSLTIGGDGRLFVKEGDKLLAVDPDGTVVWERPAHPNIAAGRSIDAAGRLLMGNGASWAVDGADGRELWVSDIPAYSEMTPGGGVSISFAGPPTIGDGGVLYYLASDRVLQAARAR